MCFSALLFARCSRGFANLTQREFERGRSQNRHPLKLQMHKRGGVRMGGGMLPSSLSQSVVSWEPTLPSSSLSKPMIRGSRSCSPSSLASSSPGIRQDCEVLITLSDFQQRQKPSTSGS